MTMFSLIQKDYIKRKTCIE